MGDFISVFSVHEKTAHSLIIGCSGVFYVYYMKASYNHTNFLNFLSEIHLDYRKVEKHSESSCIPVTQLPVTWRLTWPEYNDGNQETHIVRYSADLVQIFSVVPLMSFCGLMFGLRVYVEWVSMCPFSSLTCGRAGVFLFHSWSIPTSHQVSGHTEPWEGSWLQVQFKIRRRENINVDTKQQFQSWRMRWNHSYMRFLYVRKHDWEKQREPPASSQIPAKSSGRWGGRGAEGGWWRSSHQLELLGAETVSLLFLWSQ